MTGPFKVQYDAAQQIAAKHTSAAAGIDGLASTMPRTVDGGLGGPDVLRILAALAENAGHVVTVNTATAAAVRTSVDEFKGTDAAAAGRFHTIETDR